MKIKKYNQMTSYLARDPLVKESKGPFKEFIKDSEVSDAEDKKLMQFVIERSNDKVKGYPKKLTVKGEAIKDPMFTKYFNGGVPKNKTPLATEKNNIIIAMSETPSEEYQLQLGIELKQFEEWLKKNKNGTYKEYLKDKTAMLTEEQKKDPKIIDLEPYLPSFEDVIKKYEKEKEEESLNDFIKRRSNEMRLADANQSGLANILKKSSSL